jgi:isoquinoline 1-oxidoreductase subunit alpha
MTIPITINGQLVSVDADSSTPLLWVIREHAGLTGTKFGCGVASCGACTVHLNGAPVRSCVYPLSAAANATVTTIEGLARSAGLAEGELHPLQQAWINDQVPQCGYSQSGMLMAAAALLKARPEPTDAQIDEAMANVCRCGTYPRVRAAIKSASRSVKQEAT